VRRTRQLFETILTIFTVAKEHAMRAEVTRREVASSAGKASVFGTLYNSQSMFIEIYEMGTLCKLHLLVNDRRKLVCHLLEQRLVLLHVSGARSGESMRFTFLTIASSPSLGSSNFMLRSSAWISDVESRTLGQACP
jgi:hypothetical protein